MEDATSASPSTTACIGPGLGIAGSVTLVTVPDSPCGPSGTRSDPEPALLQDHRHDWAPTVLTNGDTPSEQFALATTGCVGSPPKVMADARPAPADSSAPASTSAPTPRSVGRAAVICASWA